MGGWGKGLRVSARSTITHCAHNNPTQTHRKQASTPSTCASPAGGAGQGSGGHPRGAARARPAAARANGRGNGREGRTHPQFLHRPPVHDDGHPSYRPLILHNQPPRKAALGRSRATTASCATSASPATSSRRRRWSSRCCCRRGCRPAEACGGRGAGAYAFVCVLRVSPR